MASKLPKLLLPAYDFKSKPVAYYAYAEAVYKANLGRREAMIKETVDKAWVSAVKDNYPKNQAKREELIKQRFLPDAVKFWAGFEKDEPGIADPLYGSRTWGTIKINGTKVALPMYDGFLYKLDYGHFASVLLPRVNPGLTCTRNIVDGAWAATIEQAPVFKKAPKWVKENALAKPKSNAAKEYWKKRSAETGD